MTSEFELMRMLGNLSLMLVDPNSTTGLQMEGWVDHRRGRARDENPYSIPRFKGCLAEGHWFEGWDASAMSAGTAETQSGSGLQPASAVPKGDAQ